jgi:hypothetical protein
MAPELLDALQRWRECAKDLRYLAHEIHDENSRLAVLRLAEGYERLLARLELRGNMITIH